MPESEREREEVHSISGRPCSSLTDRTDFSDSASIVENKCNFCFF